jgi:hypothetical protein
LSAFVSFDLNSWDADELAEPEAEELAAMTHLADLLSTAAPAFGQGLRRKGLGPQIVGGFHLR